MPARVTEGLSFLSKRRGLVPRLAGTGYVVAAAMRADRAVGPRVWGVGAAALVLAHLSTRLAKRPSSFAAWGASVALASLAAKSAGPWMDAAGIVGAAIASSAACAALGLMSDEAPSGPTLVPRRDRSPRLLGAAGALGWLVALAATVGAAVQPPAETDWMTGQAPLIAALAGVASALWLWAACATTLHDRAFVLGVADRARVARATCIAALVAMGALVFLAPRSADGIARATVALLGALVSLLALHGDAVRIVRVFRRATILAVVGGPIVLICAMVADGRAPAVFVGTLVALVVGSVAPELEGPLRPADGAWLDALERARLALSRADTEAAIRDALEALRGPAGPHASSPELWTLDPMHVLSIDAAGYPRERDAELPEGLLTVAAGEPCATVRTEVLEALEVRRPDLRRLSKWLGDRGVMTMTVITAGGEPLGLLGLPRGSRKAHVTLEEARAMKTFADSLAGVCEARSALARSQAREIAMTRRAEAAEDAALRLEQARVVEAGRHELAAARLARPAAVGGYAAASRLALEALARRVLSRAPVALIAPSGVDPVPYLAWAHLGGPRRDAPFVVVDGTASREHDPARWRDPAASPIALSDRGSLVLVDGAALPADVQRIVAQALAERRPPWPRAEPLDIALALSTTEAPSRLAADGRLDPSLAARLGDALDDPIALPRLSERPEDLRAIVTDRLAREGLRVRGAPVGIEDAAFARLAEYGFPGEDAELSGVVQRLVAALTGDVVRAADVDALRLATADTPAARPPWRAGRA